MKHNNLFYENQDKKQWWILLLLIGINANFIVGIVKQVGMGIPYGNNPMSNTGLIIVTILTLLTTILLLFSRLNTTIDENGIFIRYFPFQLKYKHFPWEDIEKVYIRKYNPIMEYGGWGIRIRLRKTNERAYNVSGNIGLQILFSNGKKVLIGTQKPDELSIILKRLGKLIE